MNRTLIKLKTICNTWYIYLTFYFTSFFPPELIIFSKMLLLLVSDISLNFTKPQYEWRSTAGHTKPFETIYFL